MFKPIEISDKPFFDDVLSHNQPEASELTFMYLFVWRDDYRFEWAVYNDVLLIVSKSRIDIPFALQPLPLDGNMTQEKLRGAVCFLKQTFIAMGKNLVFGRMDESKLKWFNQLPYTDFTVEKSDTTADYVYAGDDLRTLVGKRYSAKRNHISQFKRNYPDYAFVAINEENKHECLRIFDEWCGHNNCECENPENCEHYACIQMFENWTTLGVSGVLLSVNGHFEAFTVGERLNNETVVIRFEKGNSDIHGIYAILNQGYLQSEWPDVLFVNREEDMGIEGLAKAKQSYYPIKMISKITLFL